MVRALRAVDGVYCYDKHCPLSLWEDILSDVVFLNPQLQDDPVYIKALPKLRIATKVVWLERTPGISTTDIKERMQ